MAKKKNSDKSSQNSEGNKHEKNEINDEEPNFSDPEGYVDNVTDEETAIREQLENIVPQMTEKTFQKNKLREAREQHQNELEIVFQNMQGERCSQAQRICCKMLSNEEQVLRYSAI